MERDEALRILHEMTGTPSLLRHARTVEIVMRALAGRHGEDPETWGIAGMLHDADYERWPDEHPDRIVARLRGLGEGAIADAIAAHYTKWGRPCETLLAKALVASDELTGFVVACALVRPDRLEGLEAKSVMKRFRSKAFAAKVERDEIERGCAILGVGLGEHAQFVIDALRPHAAELGLLPESPAG
jgi:predicted hydrolase (HD superfamily)